ncbi:MAG TPA: invasion associated locus B family protein [Stellaceae bacterium]|nr:invasion associated locus B family protein [Stellaceae bacterium]
MTTYRLGRLGVLAVSLLALALPGQAAEKDVKHLPPKHVAAGPAVQRLGGTGVWNAYLYKERSGRVCYLAGGPQKTLPSRFKRKLPAAMVTHRPEENVANVVSFDEGTPLKDGSDASLEVDGTHFDLFTKGDTAWSRTSELDRSIVDAMAKGRQAVLKATSQKGPAITDIYSLSGFAQTLGLIDKACGIKR